jgi:hypothetical protein
MFTPVIKPATIRVVLSIATTKAWPIHQLDMKNVFLHGNLHETVYAQQPSGFVLSSHLNFVCKLNKSLYGLKQAPHTWFLRFTSFLSKLGFHASKSDTSLFILHHGFLTASSSTILQNIIHQLHSEFAMTDLDPLQHFLGISVQRTNDGLFLSQHQYAADLLDQANMTQCNPCLMPADTKSKPSITDGHPLDNPTEYRSLTGALQYLTLTRPDICFAIQQACLFMHSPTDRHLHLVKRILHYIKGTLHHGLHISWPTSSDLVIYSDADWAGCPNTRRSTSGYSAYLGGNLISWSSKRQSTVS